VYYFSANSGFSSSWHGYTAVAFEPAFSAVPSTPTNGNVTVTLTYPAIASVKEYKIGDGSWTAYTVPLVFTANGTVLARCSGSIGNNSPEVSFAVTNIDRTAPATPTLSADPNQPTDEIVNVTVVYPPDAHIRQVMIGHGGTWEDYAGPVPLKENCTVYARCFDAAGNESGTGSIVINYIGFYDFRYDVAAGETIITGYNGHGGDVVIPDTLGGCPVTVIARYAFQECNTITSITIPDTVYQIEHHAFYMCEGLVSLHLPDALEMIDSYAFSDCLSLASVTFPAGLSDVGDSAFAGCKNLQWAYIIGIPPKSVGADVFTDCGDEFVIYFFDKESFESPWNGYKGAMFEPELSAAPTAPTNGNVTVTIGYPAPAAVKEYRIGTGGWTLYTVPLVITTNATVYARCTDAMGGISRVLDLAVTNIDRVPPNTPVITAVPQYDTTGYVTVTISFPTDAAVKQYASEIAGGAWVTCTGPIILWENDIIYARCFDAAGNKSGVESIKVGNIITIKEGIVEKRGTTTVIDRKANLIYGLVPGITRDEFEHDYIELAGEVRVHYSSDSATLGTGTRVDVIDGHDDVIASYYIVIFGDINGDGSTDSIDAGTAVDFENYMITWDPPLDEIMPFAGDINGDGKVDSIDAGIMVDAENYMVTISQVTGLVV
jgi:hypothetical protein